MDRHKKLLLEVGEKVGDGRAEGSSATGDGPGDALMPDVDGPHDCTFESAQLEGLYQDLGGLL